MLKVLNRLSMVHMTLEILKVIACLSHALDTVD